MMVLRKYTIERILNKSLISVNGPLDEFYSHLNVEACVKKTKRKNRIKYNIVMETRFINEVILKRLPYHLKFVQLGTHCLMYLVNTYLK